MNLLLIALATGSAPLPEDMAVRFLVREVPAWSPANKCFSCHNNGNAARALYQAKKSGFRVPDSALAATTAWLSDPAGWQHNGSDPRSDNQDLSRLHFALALLDAGDAGDVKSRQPLVNAATLLARSQGNNGCWPIVPDGTVGSPTTLGTVLATAEARRVLNAAGPERFKEEIRRADDWIRHCRVQTVVDAAGVLVALEKSTDNSAETQRRACFSILHKGESKDGGWGPYVNSGPEAFDTALVVLALARQPDTPEIRAWLRRGRSYLLRMQLSDGSWQETTRPAGEVSYAERLSTSGYATRALLVTR